MEGGEGCGESSLLSELSSVSPQSWRNTHSNTNGEIQKYSGTPLILTQEESVHISEVSFISGVKLHARTVLGERKVSLLERCPHFRGVLKEMVPLYFLNSLNGQLLFCADFLRQFGCQWRL